jgi:hypothetical protein
MLTIMSYTKGQYVSSQQNKVYPQHNDVTERRLFPRQQTFKLNGVGRVKSSQVLSFPVYSFLHYNDLSL